MRKLNKDVIETAKKYLFLGATVQAVCDYLNIKSTQTFYNWIKKGEDSKSGLYYEFATAFKQARAGFQFRCLKEIHNNEKGWQRFAWMLERGFQEFKLNHVPPEMPSEIKITREILEPIVTKEENE